MPLYRGAHPIVEWFTQESMNRLSARTKKSGNCEMVAVSGGSTVFINTAYNFTRCKCICIHFYGETKMELGVKGDFFSNIP